MRPHPQATRALGRARTGRRHAATHPASARRVRWSAHRGRTGRLAGGGLMGYAIASDGVRLHYEAFGRRDAPGRVDDPGPRHRQARLGHAAVHARSQLPGDRIRQPRRGPQRQAVRHVLARTDGRRCGRRSRSRRDRRRPRRRGLDGWGDQPGDGRSPPDAGAVVDAGLHGVSQSAVAARAARELDDHRPRARHGHHGRSGGALGDRAALVPPPAAHVRLAGPTGHGPPDALRSPPRYEASSRPPTSSPTSFATSTCQRS